MFAPNSFSFDTSLNITGYFADQRFSHIHIYIYIECCFLFLLFFFIILHTRIHNREFESLWLNFACLHTHQRDKNYCERMRYTTMIIFFFFFSVLSELFHVVYIYIIINSYGCTEKTHDFCRFFTQNFCFRFIVSTSIHLHRLKHTNQKYTEPKLKQRIEHQQ